MKHYQKIIICLVVMLAAIALSQGALADQNTNAREGGAPAAEMRLETQFPPIGDIRPEAGLPQFVQYLFMLGLGLGGALAFGMIVFAGLQWSLSGASASLQGDAQDRIKNAIFGLILLLGAFVILNTINPEIVQMRAVLQLDPIMRDDPPITEPQLPPICDPWIEFSCHSLVPPAIMPTCPPGWQVLPYTPRLYCMPECPIGSFICGLPRPPIPIDDQLGRWRTQAGQSEGIVHNQELVRLPYELIFRACYDSPREHQGRCYIGRTSLARYQDLYRRFIDKCQDHQFQCDLVTTSVIRRINYIRGDVRCHLPRILPGEERGNPLTGGCIDFVIHPCRDLSGRNRPFGMCLDLLRQAIAASDVTGCLNEYKFPSPYATGAHIHCNL